MPSIGLPYASYDVEKGSTSRLVNCYIEQLPSDANTPARLIRAPGIKSRYEGSESAEILATHRMTWDRERLAYVTRQFDAAVGSNSWFFSTLTASGIAGGSGRLEQTGETWDSPYPVDIASNTSRVVIVSRPRGTTAVPTNAAANDVFSVQAITDSDFTSRGASQVEFLDNYLLFLEPESGRFFGADLGSATSFNALNFATAESQPDDAVAIKVNRGSLIVFGLSSLEIWDNTGVQGFPFQRIPNGRVDIGCLSPVSVKEVGSEGNASVAWLANDKTIRALAGLAPAKLSTVAIDRKLVRANASSHGNSWTYNGHSFYSITTQDGTFVYDTLTGQWHERRSYGLKYWRANHFTNAFGEALCAYKHHIGQLDEDTYTEVGDIQVMSWTSQPVLAEGRRAFHDRLELLCEVGEGTTTGQGSDPKIMLEISDDGGKSFRHCETKSLGAKGNRQTRVIWHHLGSSTNRVYRWSVSDPVPVTVIDTQLWARGATL